MRYLPIGMYRTLVLCSAMVLFGCGGDDPPPPTIEPVGTATCEASGLAKMDDEPCDSPAPATSPLALEIEIDAVLKAGDHRIYQVASDVDISLVSNSGDADLFLFDNVEDIDTENLYSNEKLLCGSWWSFKEDVCNASAADGEMFALVVADSDVDYRIGATADCSVPTINRWVYRNMLDYYLYAGEVPVIDPDTYSDPSDLIQDLRFETLDPFSSVNDATTQTNFFEEGVVFGLGYDWELDANDNLRMIYIFADSPFGMAGIKRGDIPVSIDGEAVIGMTGERYYELIGTVDNPLTTTWEFIDGESGETKMVSVISAEYRFNSVLHSAVYTNQSFSGKVGYIVLKQFVEPTVDELNSVIADFKESGVTELVLDLRYNGGGRASVGRRLAEQIAGSILDGKLQSRFEHNDKYTHFDYEDLFDQSTPSLDLSRVVVLTTRSTASASERLINSLRPYIEVVTMGSTTRGKAFRSSGRRYCGKILNAMQTQGINSAGVSVAGGISADCHASDDISKVFGRGEGMLQGALDYMLDGSCLAQPQLAVRSAAAQYPKTDEQLLFENMTDKNTPW